MGFLTYKSKGEKEERCFQERYFHFINKEKQSPMLKMHEDFFLTYYIREILLKEIKDSICDYIEMAFKKLLKARS